MFGAVVFPFFALLWNKKHVLERSNSQVGFNGHVEHLMRFVHTEKKEEPPNTDLRVVKRPGTKYGAFDTGMREQATGQGWELFR